MMGKQKAAVLPEPVWAQAMRSRPFRAMGMAYFWTGVGLEYFNLSMLASSSGGNFTCKMAADYCHFRQITSLITRISGHERAQVGFI